MTSLVNHTLWRSMRQAAHPVRMHDVHAPPRDAERAGPEVFLALAQHGRGRLVAAVGGRLARPLPIWLDAALQAEQLPTRVARLDAGLPDVDAAAPTPG